MVIIAGCVIINDNKVLMVKQAKAKCYGKWNFPAGHVDGAELITDAAIREVYEETGCKVKLTGTLPIYIADVQNKEPRLLISFTAEVIKENIKYDPNETLDVEWIDLDNLKNMTSDELRDSKAILQFLKDFEENKIYPIEIFSNEKYYR